ncbi:P-loop containing nucleoside triphosphate hydrolase protein, partial [Chytridium lagenaria]
AVEWPLAHRDTFARLGLKPPRGVLLYGPPGCSKTTLVKVIAATSGATFLALNGAEIFSSFLGESERTVRETFHRARLSAPTVIFLDEVDALVGKRALGGNSSGDAVQERILSTLLNEMDGVEEAKDVLVVVRPGRFDKVIYVPPPDAPARLQILEIHTLGMPLSADVDLKRVAWFMTERFTGADLENVCREAALTAVREGKGEGCVVVFSLALIVVFLLCFFFLLLFFFSFHFVD